MARTYWPGQSAIGKRIAIGDTSWITVVGVVKNTVRESWSANAGEEMYLPFFQTGGYMKGTGPRRYMTLVARVACDGRSCDASSYAPHIRDAVRGAESHAPISAVATMDAIVDDATADARFYVVLLTTFAGVALLLAAVGIYGVMSYAVSRRTREIGIRIALGAEPGVVLRGVVGEGMTLAATGAGAGLLLSLALTRLMRGILFGVGPNDLATFAGVSGALFIVALAASVVPALRATRIDPLEALRE